MIRNEAASCELSPRNSEHPSLFNDFATSTAKPRQIGKATNDLANLDLLRSVAVGLVFLTHIMGAMRIRGLGDLGRFGVLLFFVHTSLVLMLSMERLGLSGVRLYTIFMVRRGFRIYPLSVLTIAVVVAFHIPFAPWFAGASDGFMWPGWPGLFSNVLLTQNITRSTSVLCVLWSLPFEVQMYAFLPMLYILIHRFHSLRAISVIWLGGIAVAGLEYILLSNTDSDYLLLRYIPCFLAGVAAWRLMALQKRRVPGTLWIALLMALVIVYRLEDAFRVYGPNWQGLFHGSLRNDKGIWLPPSLDLFRDWAFCGIVGLAVPFFKEIKSLWFNTTTRWVAQYSYGVYLCHVPMIWVCFSLLHFGNVVTSAILTVLLTAVVSFGLYHLIENPAIQIGKHLSNRLGSAIALNVSTAS
jgi:peptidoglycan/LPS O-acetylase OafA/YrhL